MKKMAITYYHDWTQGVSMANVKISSSGVEAIKYMTEQANSVFRMDKRTKQPRLSKNGEVTMGLGFRGFSTRYLSDEETKIYKKYGDATMINNETLELVEPE